jgi:hypothetical protein
MAKSKKVAALDPVAEVVAVPAEAVTGPAPGVAVAPWEQRSKAERHGELADLALEQHRKLLSIEIDPTDLAASNLKLLAIQSNVAMSVISTQVRIDSEKLRGPNERVESERQRILEELSLREFGPKT